MLPHQFMHLLALQDKEDAGRQRDNGGGGRDVREERDLAEVVAVFERR